MLSKDADDGGKAGREMGSTEAGDGACERGIGAERERESNREPIGAGIESRLETAVKEATASGWSENLADTAGL